MKRGIIDTLRRGAENTLANWPLSVIRFGEVLLMTIAVIVCAIAALVPLLVSIGIQISKQPSPDEVESLLMKLVENWMIFVWFGLGAVVLLLVFLLIHSYVEAGCARVFADGDRAAGPSPAGGRLRFRAFSADRWIAGAKEGGWTVFWIYNLAWGAAAAILLIPCLPILALLLVFRGNPAASAGIGCLGIALILLFGIVVALVAGMWSNRAIADWAVQRTGARAAVRSGWHAVKTDLGRHLLVALAIFVVAMAGSSVFSSFSMFAAFGSSVSHNATYDLVVLPVRLIGSILSSAFGALIGSWYLASFTALAVESKP